MIDFEKAINELDLELFSRYPANLRTDKRSLLACELAVRELTPGYNYLEIGSYLGGSIQPHLLDEMPAYLLNRQTAGITGRRA